MNLANDLNSIKISDKLMSVCTCNVCRSIRIPFGNFIVQHAFHFLQRFDRVCGSTQHIVANQFLEYSENRNKIYCIKPKNIFNLRGELSTHALTLL